MPLSPYTALDLTEGGFNWCGKLLADLGADVIKIEPPGGSPTRKIGPFIDDGNDRNPDSSLFWAAYCANKRSVTLDLESEDGRARFRELARKRRLPNRILQARIHGVAGAGIRRPSAVQPRAGVHVHHPIRADRTLRPARRARPRGLVNGRDAVHMRRQRPPARPHRRSASRASRRRSSRRRYYGGFLASPADGTRAAGGRVHAVGGRLDADERHAVPAAARHQPRARRRVQISRSDGNPSGIRLRRWIRQHRIRPAHPCRAYRMDD